MDVHHHAILPGYRRALESRGIAAQPGVPFPDWTPTGSLRWMDRAGVQTALLSVGSPGFFFGDVPATAELTATCNAELDDLRGRWPERFGVFAAVPLPDLPAALDQVDDALTGREFDGVGLLTHYGGRRLGAPDWDELYALLAQAGALVHVHPTVPSGWPADQPVRPSLIEYPFETTRTIVELARNRVFSRYPGIRWIFAHGGGAFGVLADRISGGGPAAPILGGDSRQALLAHSRFDSALVGAAGLLALSGVAGTDRIVYGSDLPFVGEDRIARDRAALQRLLAG